MKWKVEDLTSIYLKSISFLHVWSASLDYTCSKLCKKIFSK